MSANQDLEKTNYSSDSSSSDDRLLAKEHSSLGAGIGAAGGGAQAFF